MLDDIQDLSLKLIQSATNYQTTLDIHRSRRARIHNYYQPRSQFNRWRKSEAGQAWKQQQLQAIDCICPGCNKRKYPEDFVIDHKIPISQGGDPTQTANLQLLCYPCNVSKGTLVRSRHKLT